MKYLMKSKFFTESKKDIKVFEARNIGEPQVGDYIICKKVTAYNNNYVDKFCENNVGRIYGIIDTIKKIEQIDKIYKVEYENVPSDVSLSYMTHNTRGFLKKDIEYWSKDKEELETILAARKYNL